MTWVKICGQRTREEFAAAAGADAMGLVVEYPADVPWNLTQDEAAERIALIPDGVEVVAVVGGDPDTVAEIVDRVRPDWVQLHADEPIGDTATIVAAMHERGVQVIKALRFDVDTGLCRTGTDPVLVANELAAIGVDRLLVDSVSSTRVAGTGARVNRDTARRIVEAATVPVILAGGLNPDNVAEAIAEVQPFGVDVISGVEGADHHKDPALVAAFLAAVRAAG